jgi:gliding motility-associated-like protein
MQTRWFALLLSLSSSALTAMGQCTGGIDLGPDTTLCDGQVLVLAPGGGFIAYDWNNGASSAPEFTVNAPGTYTCTVGYVDMGGDLVVNGDFSQGYMGFSSGYTIGAGGPWGPLSNEGTYAIAALANQAHTNFQPCTDHTGGGSMMVVNGAQEADVPVWCQTVEVQPGMDYAFSAWLATMVAENPAVLQFTINGEPIGDPLAALLQTCTWTQFHAVWNAGTNTTAEICISNQNVVVSGNDFALDDISFRPFCTYSDTITVGYAPVPVPDLGPDLTLCSNAPYVLDPGVPDADSYLWNGGLADTPQLTITSQGWYWVDVTTNGCTGTDSVWVGIINLPGVDLGPDRELCQGESVTFATNLIGTHLWHDGSTGPTWTATASAEVWVQVTSGPCAVSDTVVVLVHPVPAPDLGPDQHICGEGPIALDAGVAGETYEWNHGAANTRRWWAEATGWYHVSVTANGCTGEDSVHIELVPAPVVDLGGDRELCYGDSIVLLVDAPDGAQILWHDGSTGTSWTGWDSADAWVVLTLGPCVIEDEARILFEQCEPIVDLPNVFTPNSDGTNTLFTPIHVAGVQRMRVDVFNRWGQLVFSSASPNFGWNGRSPGGEHVPEGTYFWTLECEGIKGGTVTRNGAVTLLR